MGKLTAKKVQGKLKAGMHNDGFGLYLRVSSTGGKSWLLRCRVNGVTRDTGLGGISWISLAGARERAVALGGGNRRSWGYVREDRVFGKMAHDNQAKGDPVR